MKFVVPIGANPIISMWGEKNNFSMVLVGHRSVKREKKMQRNLGRKMSYIDAKRIDRVSCPTNP
jgi:hypothetical protein